MLRPADSRFNKLNIGDKTVFLAIPATESAWEQEQGPATVLTVALFSATSVLCSIKELLKDLHLLWAACPSEVS